MNALKSAQVVMGLVIALAATSGSAVAPYQVTGYKSEISVVSAHEVSIAAVVSGIGDLRRSPLEIAIFRYPSQKITGMRVVDSEGRPAFAQTNVTTGAVLLKIAGTDSQNSATSQLSSFNIAFVVLDPHGSIVRIPMPVPQAKSPLGTNAVQIRLILPPGSSHVRDSFPSFNWTGLARGDAMLSSVPSIVIAHWKPADSIGAADNLLSATMLTNAGMVVLLATGSLIWWFSSGRAARSARRKASPLERLREI